MSIINTLEENKILQGLQLGTEEQVEQISTETKRPKRCLICYMLICYVAKVFINKLVLHTNTLIINRPGVAVAVLQTAS